jgi:hypothetical protein
MFNSKTIFGALAEVWVVTVSGPPERIMAFGLNSEMYFSATSKGNISQ